MVQEKHICIPDLISWQHQCLQHSLFHPWTDKCGIYTIYAEYKTVRHGKWINTSTNRQDSFRMAYWIRFKANPGSSLFNMTGAWPICFMRSFVLFAVVSLVHGARTISTSGTRYGGLTCQIKEIINNAGFNNIKVLHFEIIQLEWQLIINWSRHQWFWFLLAIKFTLWLIIRLNDPLTFSWQQAWITYILPLSEILC